MQSIVMKLAPVDATKISSLKAQPCMVTEKLFYFCFISLTVTKDIKYIIISLFLVTVTKTRDIYVVTLC